MDDVGAGGQHSGSCEAALVRALMLASHPGQPFKNMGIPSLFGGWSQNGCFGRGAEIGLRGVHPSAKSLGMFPRLGTQNCGRDGKEEGVMPSVEIKVDIRACCLRSGTG